jgi:hypothetical protein
MSTTTTERIVQTLESVGYKRVPPPLAIAGLTFDFQAVFLGDERSLDLILVADMAFDDQRQLLRNVEGVARTLDVIRSKRPITLVLAGPKPSGDVLEAMSRVCRVLPINSAKTEDIGSAVRNSLAVLLPLEIPNASAATAEPMKHVEERSSELDADVREVIPVAQHGANAVQGALHKLLLQQLPTIAKENER